MHNDILQGLPRTHVHQLVPLLGRPSDARRLPTAPRRRGGGCHKARGNYTRHWPSQAGTWGLAGTGAGGQMACPPRVERKGGAALVVVMGPTRRHPTGHSDSVTWVPMQHTTVPLKTNGRSQCRTSGKKNTSHGGYVQLDLRKTKSTQGVQYMSNAGVRPWTWLWPRPQPSPVTRKAHRPTRPRPPSNDPSSGSAPTAHRLPAVP